VIFEYSTIVCSSNLVVAVGRRKAWKWFRGRGAGRMEDGSEGGEQEGMEDGAEVCEEEGMEDGSAVGRRKGRKMVLR
jgi:hypothetical protein